MFERVNFASFVLHGAAGVRICQFVRKGWHYSNIFPAVFVGSVLPACLELWCLVEIGMGKHEYGEGVGWLDEFYSFAAHRGVQFLVLLVAIVMLL